MRFDDSELSLIHIPTQVAELLINAPPAVIKLYLYGKVRTEFDWNRAMEELDMSRGELAEAITYMQKSGMVTTSHSGDGSIVYTYPRRQPEPALAEMYKDADYNRTLQQLFGQRPLKHSDYRAIYELTDIFGMPRPVVLMLLEYCIGKKGERVSMKFITDEALRWTKDNIDTISRAQDYMDDMSDARSDMRAILRQLGVTARVNADYMEHYKKWTHDWGISMAVIRRAVTETNMKANMPSVEYLERVLENYHTRGLHTTADIDAESDRRSELRRLTTELLSAAGVSRRPTNGDAELYRRLSANYGMSHELLLTAAKKASAYKNPIAALETIAKGWHEAGVTTVEQALAQRKGPKKDYAERDYRDEEFAVRDILSELAENEEYEP